MSCGCSPYVTHNIACNQTISACLGRPVDIIIPNCPVTILQQPSVGSIEILNGKIRYNTPSSTNNYSTSFIYSISCTNQICQITINIQEPNNASHTIELDACASECEVGDTTFLWSGFEDGCIELHPDSSIYDCKIKVIVFDNCQKELKVKICCGACNEGCCKEKSWFWQPPTYNNNCLADCSIYPCTNFNEVTGNCEPICEDCEQCCEQVPENINVVHQCVVSGNNVTVTFLNTTGTGSWYVAGLQTIELNNNCATTSYLVPAQDNIQSNGGIFTLVGNNLVWTIAQNNIETTGNLTTGGGFVVVFEKNNYKKYYVFYILEDTLITTPSYPCSAMYFSSNYHSSNNLLSPAIPMCISTTSNCADCCNNNDCLMQNCPCQPICSNGECKCFINGLEVPRMANGCCPCNCTDDTILPFCHECENGIVVDNTPICTQPFVLNTSTCSCQCPTGTIYNPATNTCVGQPCYLNNPPCPPCFNCLPNGLCEPITVPCPVGTITNPNPTIQDPRCCIPSPCIDCQNSLELVEICNDLVPTVTRNGNNFSITWNQLDMINTTDCSNRPILNNTLNGIQYQVNVTNFIGDWQPLPLSGLSYVGNIINGDLLQFPNGFLIKANWHGREAVYEVFFNNNGTFAITKVSTEDCKKYYKLTSTCNNVVGYMWEGSGLVWSNSTENIAVVSSGNVCVSILLNDCETNEQCITIPPCSGGCGCDACANQTLGATINETETGTHKVLHASIFRNCVGSTYSPLMYTCAPPTSNEYSTYLSNGTLPDNCGTFPEMFSNRPICTTCSTYTCCNTAQCCTGANCKSLCGWWLETDKVENLEINGANITFDIKSNIDKIDVCFGANTDCGYACTCRQIENPTYECNFNPNLVYVCNYNAQGSSSAILTFDEPGNYTITNFSPTLLSINNVPVTAPPYNINNYVIGTELLLRFTSTTNNISLTITRTINGVTCDKVISVSPECADCSPQPTILCQQDNQYVITGNYPNSTKLCLVGYTTTISNQLIPITDVCDTSNPYNIVYTPLVNNIAKLYINLYYADHICSWLLDVPPCCSAPALPIINIVNNVCPSVEGSISATCTAGTLKYSTDGINWTTTAPIYDHLNVMTIYARCELSATCYSQTSVNTAPVDCPINPSCEPISGEIIGTISPNRHIYTPVCEPKQGSFDITTNTIVPNGNNFPIELLLNPSIQAIGYGYKTSNNIQSEELCYVVTVDKKLPVNEIPTNLLIPKSLNGIKTDVIEPLIVDPFYYDHTSNLNSKTQYFNGTGSMTSTNSVSCNNCVMPNPGEQFCFDALQLASTRTATCPTSTSNCYPLAGVMSSHNDSYYLNNTVYGGQSCYREYNSSYIRGTICLVAKETSTGKLVALTNNHVLGAYEALTIPAITVTSTTNFKQASGTTTPTTTNTLNWASGYEPQYGSSYKALPFSSKETNCPSNDPARFNQVADAGIILLEKDYAATDIHEIGTGPFEWLTEQEFGNGAWLVGKPVYKSGATTGTKIEIGKVTSTNITTQQSGRPCTWFVNQIELKPISMTINNPTTTVCADLISLGGDSGSPILIEIGGKLKVLGILWGGSAYMNSTINLSTIISPIWAVKEALGIEAWNGDIIVDSSAPFITLTKNGRIYQKTTSTSLDTTHTMFTEQTIQPTCQ